MTEPTTHDYRQSTKRWGHDLGVLNLLPDNVIETYGWGRGIKEGDYVLLTNSPLGTDTRYQVKEIEYKRDPADMWFAKLAFAPRGVQSDFQKVMDS